ncbi:molecular chaperone HtpG [Candidatus Fermentibacteria bacterium]|nr:molecular chaperone HtpG [Candidatus Fermentibacteria bacterium]
MSDRPRKLKFKAETKKILDIVINSLYSHHDIFLRELISNASDALDKLRFESLTDPDILDDDYEPRIEIIPDQEAKTLTVRDNGTGMTEEEMATELGTIASSGSRSFLEMLKEGKSKDVPKLIGQFGVGFYSSFMVADEVEVLSRKAGSDEPGHKWVSKGEETFTLREAPDLPFGTSVILHLEEDMLDYLQEHRIRTLVSRYSDFIAYPIVLAVPGSDERPVLNSQKPIWTRPEEELTEGDYKEFYSHLAYDTEQPLGRIVFHGEGVTEFYALLFIPRSRQPQLMLPDYKCGVSLYVKRVMIKEEAEELLPRYLRFVRGVVESSDLPLNISRELLQSNATVRTIHKALTRKVIDYLAQMREDRPDDYARFFDQFGDLIKEGIYSDYERQDELADLLLVYTSESPEELKSLKELVEGLPEDQETIPYVTGADRRELAGSPYLEAARKKGREALLFDSPMDEIMLQGMSEYGEKKLVSLAKEPEEEKLTEEQQKHRELAEEAFGGLLEFLKDQLGDKVSDVRFTSRLHDSPCMLVSTRDDPGEAMKTILKAMKEKVPEFPKILELNPEHPLIGRLQEFYEEDRSSEKMKRYVNLLYNVAVVMAGGRPEDPARFGKAVAELMAEE